MATPIVTLPHHPMPISIATPSRDSMTFTSTKGLLNGPGQNNCFLNSAVQVLWHLDIFRRSFRDLSGHACMADSCIFCALKELFSQLQFSNETALPPDALRRALAESFFDQQRFQLGFMDDAAECFENMLLRIHMHIAHGEAEDMCNARHCIPHQKFAMTLVEQSVCNSCGASSEPLSYTQMVHYVSTSTLVYQVRTNRPQGIVEPFGQLLRKAGSMGDVRVCPSSCGAVIQIGRTLMNRPEIVSVGLVWNSERPTLEHIMEVFSTIGTTLRLSEVFNTVVDSRWAETCIHNLVGVVTYYGKHYSTFFFHTKLRVWIYFDDATVREVGPRWEQVVEKCRKGRYQPLLLLYASPDGTPVNTDNAPKQVTAFYNADKMSKKPPTSPMQQQQQSMLRRSVTPSPEKPIVGNTRRAITPNPDGINQRPPLPRSYNEYQNLSVIQSNLYNTNRNGVDVVDGDMRHKDVEYKTTPIGGPKAAHNIHRTLSNGSSSGTEMCFRDYLNIPRTRDSGNWSSDRNSASSASSTTMENPYLYLLGKVPHDSNLPSGGSVGHHLPPRNESSSSNSSGVYDVGYDSYSLSSNDSSTMTTIQHLMKMGHLAKIPEDYNTTAHTHISQSCDVLCNEADELLVKSRQLEDDHDLVLALALCNAAATKARAAMDAPYNNPQTLTLARMKHNTCIMRARSLHRRMTQNSTNSLLKDQPPEIRHTREGSSGSGRHSRQSSRDKGQHSRQNSKELLCAPAEKPATKNIEIYATLPKKKDALKKIAINFEEDADYVVYDKPPGRESRSIFSRSKNKESKTRDKRSRSEDRNKMTRDLSIAPEVIITGKDTLKKGKEEKEEKKDKDGKPKKQHKIRRKLLMGGLIRRKNRSMPDLTDANADKDRRTPSSAESTPNTTMDDSSVGLKGANESAASMCGYLSEGHLEFTGNNTNPNLERSKLMRKSFHCSAGKILTAAKVPPPPPLRTTSQLSKSKLNCGEVCEEKNGGDRPQYPLPNEIIQNDSPQYCNTSQFPFNSNYNAHVMTSPTLPYANHYNNNKHLPHYQPNMVVTRADVHQEQEQNHQDSGVDEVDCMPLKNMGPSFDLPPYPSPLGSAIHSRQASEDFPPPPPPLDLSALDEHLPKVQSPTPSPPPGSLLAQLQNKRQEILSQESENKIQTLDSGVRNGGGDTWLKELQAKQAALRLKKSQTTENNQGVDTCDPKHPFVDSKVSSVKDLANKFETIQVQPLEISNTSSNVARIEKTYNQQQQNFHGVLTTRKREEVDVAPFVDDEQNDDGKRGGGRCAKKKSVSFCDQVILVATAEEQEEDSYIPNPILERVLRSAMNKPETAAVRQEVMALRQAEHQTATPQHQEVPDNYSEENNKQQYQSVPAMQVQQQHPPQMLQSPAQVLHQQTQQVMQQQQQIHQQHPGYVRRNSLENLLSRPDDADRQIYVSNQQQTPYRQSPYQRIPQNSPVYMYNNNNNNSPVGKPPTSPSYQIPPQYKNGYHPQQQDYAPARMAQMRQSPNPHSPNNYHHQAVQNGPLPVYQHPPSPAPTANVNYNYQQQQQNMIYNSRAAGHNVNYDNNRVQYSPCQRIPTPCEQNGYGPKNESDIHQQQQQMNGNYSPYQPVPGHYYSPPESNSNLVRHHSDAYQRVPPPHMEQDYQSVKYPPYQHALPPKQLLKKTVSFEPGTKGGCESPTPIKAVVTPIMVNNVNTAPTKNKCNLCRKKNVVSSNAYCTDCEFYMSRFKPKR